MRYREVLLVLIPLVSSCTAERASRAAVFEEVWTTVRERFFDPRLAGVDWPAARETALPAVRAARTDEEFARTVNRMLHELSASHTAYFTRQDPACYVLLEPLGSARAPARARLYPHGPPPLPGSDPDRGGRRGAFVRGVSRAAAESAGPLGDRLISVEANPSAPRTRSAGARAARRASACSARAHRTRCVSSPWSRRAPAP
jgi:carboxyl-terminal processing protease